MDKPLNERIQAAIKAGKSQGVESLIFEAEAASKQAVADHDEARERALDPLLSDGEIAAARKAVEDASFIQERMTKAAAVLREKLGEFKEAEEQAQLTKIYKAAIAKRDAASARLKAEYRDLANKLGALLEEVAAADREVDAANYRLPAGGNRIMGVEQHARPGWHHSSRPLVRMDIPSFSRTGRPEMIWGRDNSIAGTRVFDPETTNAEKVHLTPKPRPGPARSPDALASPVGNSKQGEAA
ncbi:hypothetical protein VQ042_08060 [Aurantimonas sp. A2-1-M11]|uniref:hypothetical protein n=1 Tax=Aurantimonas sp. A2-1-M11 TaxID=3113712 RepID=UPI002F9580F7